jgi:hypothetical protein
LNDDSCFVKNAALHHAGILECLVPFVNGIGCGRQAGWQKNPRLRRAAQDFVIPLAPDLPRIGEGQRRGGSRTAPVTHHTLFSIKGHLVCIELEYLTFTFARSYI